MRIISYELLLDRFQRFRIPKGKPLVVLPQFGKFQMWWLVEPDELFMNVSVLLVGSGEDLPIELMDNFQYLATIQQRPEWHVFYKID